MERFFFKKTDKEIELVSFRCVKRYQFDQDNEFLIIERKGTASIEDSIGLSEIPLEHFVIGSYPTYQEALDELKEFKKTLLDDKYVEISCVPNNNISKTSMTEMDVNWNMQRVLIFSYLQKIQHATKAQVIDYLNEEFGKYGKELSPNARNTVGAFLTLNGSKHSKGTGYLTNNNGKWALTEKGKVCLWILRGNLNNCHLFQSELNQLIDLYSKSLAS